MDNLSLKKITYKELCEFVFIGKKNKSDIEDFIKQKINLNILIEETKKKTTNFYKTFLAKWRNAYFVKKTFLYNT